MFFRMRRQHAFELKTSLERAIKGREDPCSSSNTRSSNRGCNGEDLAETGDGDEGGTADGVEGEQAFSKSPSEHGPEGVRRR